MNEFGMKPAQREFAFVVDDALEKLRRQFKVSGLLIESLVGFRPDGGSAVDTGSGALDFRPKTLQVRFGFRR